MPSPRKIKGELVQHERPDWEPLANALLGWFMWMHEVELADGRRVHAYKHRMSRRYLHVSSDETAFEYWGDDGYREVELDVAILRVLERWRPLEWSDEADRATP